MDDELRELFEKVPDGVLVEVLLEDLPQWRGAARPRGPDAGDLEDLMQAMLQGRRPRFLTLPLRGGCAARAPSAQRRGAWSAARLWSS